MSLYTSFVSGVLFPLHERLKHHDSVQRRKQLEASQWLSPQGIEAIQSQNLQRFIADIIEHVPWYRSLFQQLGLSASDIQHSSDLQKLPFLDKEIIRNNSEALKADDALELRPCSTGGSSGEPLLFHVGRDRVSHDVAAKWRATRWWDVDIGDREIVIWGSPVELNNQDRMRLLRDKLLRSKLLSAFDLSLGELDHIIQQIRDFRPPMIFGYPTSLSVIAKRAHDQGIAMDDLGVKVVFVTSEMLYDDQRAMIEQVFACPVANGYGGRDAGFTAHQCPHGSLHISAEDMIVELIDKHGQPVAEGESGEVVVTHLASRDYPFVRYRTGDMAIRSNKPCGCGRGLPVLAKIQGRSTDWLVTSAGDVLHSAALVYDLRELMSVDAFKIEQLTRQETRILLCTNRHWQAGHGEQIIATFKRCLGEDVDIRLEHVDHIPRSKSGKFHYIVSHVAESVIRF